MNFFMKIGQMDFAAKSFPIISINLCSGEKVFDPNTFETFVPFESNINRIKIYKKWIKM